MAMAAVHLYLTRTIRDILLAQRRDTLTQEVRTAVAQFAGQWAEASNDSLSDRVEVLHSVNRVARE